VRLSNDEYEAAVCRAGAAISLGVLLLNLALCFPQMLSTGSEEGDSDSHSANADESVVEAAKQEMLAGNYDKLKDLTAVLTSHQMEELASFCAQIDDPEALRMSLLVLVSLS
jgi:hypothetical protein